MSAPTKKTVKLDQKRGHARSGFIHHARKPLRGSAKQHRATKTRTENYFCTAAPRGNLIAAG
jgi:hypothetical protein